MDIDKNLALTVALERIVKLEDELIFANTLIRQLQAQLQELQTQDNKDN